MYKLIVFWRHRPMDPDVCKITSMDEGIKLAQMSRITEDIIMALVLEKGRVAYQMIGTLAIDFRPCLVLPDLISMGMGNINIKI